ncbi:hypothetical protein F2Q69_00033072 [Brassica cretica]|uniref:Retrotransposon gag domain-containing protein n=1 Tax=Brassica cretica TaxID=69181 RepID=A0A8S9SMQ2_BRACR|nr:hypothetical protein F2Q69_00033072 [Brassica cretica]
MITTEHGIFNQTTAEVVRLRSTSFLSFSLGGVPLKLPYLIGLGMCITSRHTRRNAQGELVTFSNQKLTRLKRTNRQQSGPNNAIMGDYSNKEQLTAQLQQMQQQMLQMQQTIQAQQDAAEQAALVDQLLKNNQGHVFNMEQAAAGQIQNQNQRQPQNNQQVVPATGNNQSDELKGLRMMMQQLLQGEQVQAKGLNQVTTEMDTRMGNMFTELNNKCITSRHTRRNAQGELVTFSNQELTRLKRTNRQQSGPNNAIMGDYNNKEQLTAQLQQMQQQMLQMQQTIQAQQDVAEQAALKIDELAAKVDQLLKNNQGHVFNMEQATAGQIQNQNQRQPQNNQQVVSATGNNQSDELKGLRMMMQQLLQGEQVQAKGLNQVTTEMDTRMGNMFTELNNKYDNLAIHIRKIDVQLAQTVESFKRQQETLPGRTDKNPRTEHCNAIEQPFTETVLGAEEDTEQPASSAVTAPDESAETPPSRVYVPKVPYPIPPRHLMNPIIEEHLIGFNKMVRKLPKELAFKDALQIRPLFKFFKNCRETQEEIKVLYTKALSTPALKVLSKVDDPGKFVFPCSIAGTTFKDALCDSRSCVNLVSKAIVDDLEKLKVVSEKEHGDKGESRTVLMTVPDSGATRATVPDSGTTRVPVPAAEIFKETTT